MLSRSLAHLLGTVVALAVPAAAEAAYTATSVNLRSGPGTDYGVILTLPAGAHVNVHDCQPSWCSVTADGYNGCFGLYAVDFDRDDRPRTRRASAEVFARIARANALTTDARAAALEAARRRR